MKIVKIALIFLLPIILLACGGGGSAGANSSTITVNTSNQETSNTSPEQQALAIPTTTPTPEDFSADKSLVDSDAADSTELTVEDYFNFDQTRTVSFSLKAQDSDGLPMTDKIITIKSLPEDLSSWDDSRLSHAELLLVTKTNLNGEASRTLELPLEVGQVLLQINALGIENQAMVVIENESPMLVEHTFN